MQFNELISAIGTNEFGAVLFGALNRAFGAEEVVVHRYLPRRPVQVLVSGASGGAKALDSAVRLYVGSYHRRDPLLARLTTAITPAPLVGRIDADEILDADYRRRLFLSRGIHSKTSMLMRDGEQVTTLSAYRCRGDCHGDHDITFLTQWFATLAAVVEKHSSLVAPTRFETLEGVVGVLQNASCGKLSAREAAVCARILCGYSTEGTGLDLKLSNNSVATYRRRAYGKLGISSQSELFRLVLRHAAAEGELKH